MRNFNEKPAYIRLLNLLSAIRELSPLQDLTAEEEKLLGQLTIRWHETDQLTVGEMMGDADLVSSSTVYRRLLCLRDKGFIDLPTDIKDKRVRLVLPATLAKKYMKQLDQCVLKLFNEQGD